MTTDSRPRADHLRPAHDLPGDGPGEDWAATIPHDCITEPAGGQDQQGNRGMSGSRLVGIDAARGIALVGMVAVHVFSADTENGGVSLAWALASGKSSALFAILGGVGLAFMSGRQSPPRGAEWIRVILRQLIRAVVIIAIGFLLGAVAPWEDIALILPYLGVMFAIGALLTPFGPRTLLTLGLTWAVAAPFLSMYLRLGLPTMPRHNITFETFLADPSGDTIRLLFTGFFPVITWISYIMIGMGLGRTNLGSRRNAAGLIAGGVTVTLIAWGATLVLLQQFDVRSRIAAVVMEHTSLDTFTDYLVFGADGELPTDTWWWLGINAPHTGTPLDLLYTAGIAMTVIGVCLGISHVTGSRMALLAVPGSMTLTLYAMHALLTELLGDLPEPMHFAVQSIILVTFAMVWHRFIPRGPLEGMLAWLTRTLVPAPRRAAVSPAAERWND